MDTLIQDTISEIDQATLQNAVEFVLHQWETAFPHADGFRILAIRDTVRNQYLVLHEGWHADRHEDDVLIHLEIRNHKIWILANNTSDEIGQLLQQRGIPRHAIVVGFIPPERRIDSDYATG